MVADVNPGAHGLENVEVQMTCSLVVSYFLTLGRSGPSKRSAR